MSKLTLNSVEWGEFRIKDLFEIETVKGKPIESYKKGNIPYVSTAATNNAVINFIEKDKNIITSAFAITVDPIKGTCFFHDYAFVGRGFSGASVNVLRNINLNKYNGMFICSSIEKTSKLKASYGYLFNSNRLKMGVILLPIDSKSNPNWKFMEDYIKQEMKAQSQKVIAYYENKLMKLGFELLDLEDVEWEEFKVKDLFEVKPVKGKSITHYKGGKIPYVTTSSVDNGLNNFIDTEENISLKKCISIDPIGGKSFFHEYDFVGRGGAGSAINLLYNNALDKYSGLFICKMLESSSFSKASYGVQLNGNRLKNLKILLPINRNDEPHWKYMNNFIKKLEKENIEKVLSYLRSYND